jgi:hypothetical protein
MAARHDEHNGRHRHLAALEDERLDMPGQVVDGNHGHAARPRKRLRE